MKTTLDVTFNNIDSSVFVKKLYKKAEELNGREFFHFDEFIRFVDDNDLINVKVKRSDFGNLLINVEVAQ